VEKERLIAHVDMDAFFAAVEQRDNPHLRGKPVIVGADPKEGRGRGVVAACSYEARKYGIHSAMPISFAYRRCPHAAFLRGDMKKYAKVSSDIFEILERFSPDVEPISIDEGFIDLTVSYKLFGSPEETCKKIKTVIKQETGLTASIGLAPNKMTAKIASDLDKPNGLVIVKSQDLLKFLHALPVEKLWGVGKSTLSSLKKLGIHKVGDLAQRDKKQMIDLFGKHGIHLWKLSRGIDPRPVKPNERVKSIGNERTYTKDETDIRKIENTLMFLSEKVSRRLRKSGFKGRTITLKIRFSDFKTYTRAVSLTKPTNFVEDIYKNVRQKAHEFPLGIEPVRLIGVSVSNLGEHEQQSDLFATVSANSEKKEKLHTALDEIKDRFGESAIKYKK